MLTIALLASLAYAAEDKSYLPKTILRDREDLNIYVNKPWDEL